MNQKTTHKRNLKRDQPNNNILQEILTTSKLFSLKSDDYFEIFPKGSLDHAQHNILPLQGKINKGRKANSIM
jgi:hypothetical protein